MRVLRNVLVHVFFIDPALVLGLWSMVYALSGTSLTIICLRNIHSYTWLH